MTPELLDLVEMLHICDDPKRLAKLENFFYDPNYNEAAKAAEAEDLTDNTQYTEEDKETAKKLLDEIRNERNKTEKDENEIVLDEVEENPNDFEVIE